MNATQESEVFGRLVDEEGLDEAQARRAITLFKRGEILAAVVQAYANGVANPRITSDLAELKALNDELDRIVPPDEEELAV